MFLLFSFPTVSPANLVRIFGNLHHERQVFVRAMAWVDEKVIALARGPLHSGEGDEHPNQVLFFSKNLLDLNQPLATVTLPKKEMVSGLDLAGDLMAVVTNHNGMLLYHIARQGTQTVAREKLSGLKVTPLGSLPLPEGDYCISMKLWPRTEKGDAVDEIKTEWHVVLQMLSGRLLCRHLRLTPQNLSDKDISASVQGDFVRICENVSSFWLSRLCNRSWYSPTAPSVAHMGRSISAQLPLEEDHLDVNLQDDEAAFLAHPPMGHIAHSPSFLSISSLSSEAARAPNTFSPMFLFTYSRHGLRVWIPESKGSFALGTVHDFEMQVHPIGVDAYNGVMVNVLSGESSGAAGSVAISSNAGSHASSPNESPRLRRGMSTPSPDIASPRDEEVPETVTLDCFRINAKRQPYLQAILQKMIEGSNQVNSLFIEHDADQLLLACSSHRFLVPSLELLLYRALQHNSQENSFLQLVIRFLRRTAVFAEVVVRCCRKIVS